MCEFSCLIKESPARVAARNRGTARDERTDPTREVVVVLTVTLPLEARVVRCVRESFRKRLSDAQSSECRMRFSRWPVEPADPSDAGIVGSMRSEMKMHKIDKAERIGTVTLLPRRAREREKRLHRESIRPEVPPPRVTGGMDASASRKACKELARALDAHVVARFAEGRGFSRAVLRRRSSREIARMGERSKVGGITGGLVGFVHAGSKRKQRRSNTGKSARTAQGRTMHAWRRANPK